MKIVAISDLHGYLPDDLPVCDVVCICGDIVPLNVQFNIKDSLKWLSQLFVPWVKKLECTKVVMIWGNHDFIGEQYPAWANYINEEQGKLIVLQDSQVEINGKIFYGTPWCPDLCNWAFYANHETLLDKFGMIPNDVDVLLSHCAPKIGKVGEVCQGDVFNFGRNYGCQELADAIDIKTPHLCICGHVHSGQHKEILHNTSIIANVSLKDEKYAPTYKVSVFEL